MRLHDLEFEWEYAEDGYIQFSAAGEGAETIDCADLKNGLLAGSYQQRAAEWLEHCFGETGSPDRKKKRAWRFFEESIELAQALGVTKDEWKQLLDRTYSRETGEVHQEVGGVMLTLAGVCESSDLKISDCAETELARVWTKVDSIRAKNARQVEGSPLPGDDE